MISAATDHLVEGLFACEDRGLRTQRHLDPADAVSGGQGERRAESV